MSKTNLSDQKRFETYTPSQMSEILNLLIYKTELSPSTKKFLGYFRNKKGATMAKFTTICEKVGISDRTYRRTVRNELETFFGSPIFGTKKTRKLSKNRSQKVTGSEIKFLLPFKAIKYLLDKYFKQQEEELSEIPEEIAAAEAMAAAASVPVSVHVSDMQKAETPSESKVEEPFSHEQKKAFREKPLKDLKTIFNITGGAFKIKKSIQKFIFELPFAAFKDFKNWSQSKQYAIANALQLALVTTKSDIEDTPIKFTVRNAISACFDKYENKPQDQLVKLLYTYVFNAIKPEEDENVSEEQEERSAVFEEPAAAAIEEDPAVATALQAARNREIDELLRKVREPKKARKSEPEILQEIEFQNSIGLW